MEPDVFAVDTGELAHVVDQMTACESMLHELAADLERRVASLHISWDGESAAAQLVAQAEWEHGFRGMREALAVMRAVGRLAHGNYTAAAETNLQLWEQVR
jgi:WXG100 family type VII secretion target